MTTQFANGNVEITLSQQDMARAVEYWLNDKVLKVPCSVVKMTESRVNIRSSFEIILREEESETQ